MTEMKKKLHVRLSPAQPRAARNLALRDHADERAADPHSRSAIDRRNAAVHEAGHIVVARHLGLKDVFGWIFERWGAGEGEKTWGGETRFRKPPRFAVERRMINFAGALAEYAWRREDFDPLFYEPDHSLMSASDWGECTPGELYRDDVACEAIRRVVVLLDPGKGDLWAELCRTAHGLMVEERERRLRQQRLRIIRRLTVRAVQLASG